MRVKEVELPDGSTALATDGAPSDCVALAVLGVVEESIDLVVSGINPNANLGHDVTYSGTVTAAMEAVIWDLPGIAVSLETPDKHLGTLDYEPAARVAKQVVERVILQGLPQGTLLNVNVPYRSLDEIQGIKITRQRKFLLTESKIAVKSVGMLGRSFPPVQEIRPRARARVGVFFAKNQSP